MILFKWRGLYERLTGLEIVGCGGWFTNGVECGRNSQDWRLVVVVGDSQVERIVAEIDRIGDCWLWWMVHKWRGVWQRSIGLQGTLICP